MPDVSRPPVVTVYVLKGSTGRRYIGITNDLSRRLREHRAKKTKGGQILEEFRVLYREQFPDHNMAREREKFLKSGQGRKWLDELESKTGPARGG
jgi:putative endonuclease